MKSKEVQVPYAVGMMKNVWYNFTVGYRGELPCCVTKFWISRKLEEMPAVEI